MHSWSWLGAAETERFRLFGTKSLCRRQNAGFQLFITDWFGMTTYIKDFFDTLGSPCGRAVTAETP